MSYLDGYIIANSGWEDAVKMEMGARTFATSAAYAWRYHIGFNVSDRDASTYIQRWHDKGYKPFKVRLSLVPPAPGPTFRRAALEAKE